MLLSPDHIHNLWTGRWKAAGFHSRGELLLAPFLHGFFR